MLPNFLNLKSNYPTHSASKLAEELGGDWPELIKKKEWRNTCAVRLSVAFNKSGLSVANFKEANDGSGGPLIVRVKTMGKFVKEHYGEWSWGMSKPVGSDIVDEIPKWRGIIAYHADWSDATGHFDLWDKNTFVGTGNTADIADGFDVMLWRLE